MYQKLKCNKCPRVCETDTDKIIKKLGWYYTNKICLCPEHNKNK